MHLISTQTHPLFWVLQWSRQVNGWANPIGILMQVVYNFQVWSSTRLTTWPHTSQHDHFKQNRSIHICWHWLSQQLSPLLGKQPIIFWRLLIPSLLYGVNGTHPRYKRFRYTDILRGWYRRVGVVGIKRILVTDSTRSSDHLVVVVDKAHANQTLPIFRAGKGLDMSAPEN